MAFLTVQHIYLVFLAGMEGGWFLQEPHGVTSHKTAFFIATAMKTSNLT
jgi:hypothetical protein